MSSKSGVLFSGLDTKIEAEADSSSYSSKAKGAAVSLGLTLPVVSDLSLTANLGYGEVGESSTKYYDRFIKVLLVKPFTV